MTERKTGKTGRSHSTCVHKVKSQAETLQSSVETAAYLGGTQNFDTRDA